LNIIHHHHEQLVHLIIISLILGTIDVAYLLVLAVWQVHIEQSNVVLDVISVAWIASIGIITGVFLLFTLNRYFTIVFLGCIISTSFQINTDGLTIVLVHGILTTPIFNFRFFLLGLRVESRIMLAISKNFHVGLMEILLVII